MEQNHVFELRNKSTSAIAAVLTVCDTDTDTLLKTYATNVRK